MWVEFVVGSRLRSEIRGVSSRTSVFPSPQKPTFLNYNSIRTQWTKKHPVDVPLLIPIYLFIYLFIILFYHMMRDVKHFSF